jgi:MFS family permease
MTSRTLAAAPETTLARWSVSAIFFVNGVGVGLWAAHIPLVARRFNLDNDFIGLVLLCLGLGAMAAMTLAGAACARFGTRAVARVTAFGFALAVPLPILAPSLVTLFAAALTFGVCNGALDVAMNAQASEIETARGKSTMASFHAFFSTGGLAGAALGGLIIGAGLGDGRGALMAMAVILALLVLVTARLFVTPEAEAPPAHFERPRRAALSLGLLALACMVVEGAVADWSALLLTTHAGATAAVGAAGYAAFSIAMAACRFAGDSLIDALGPRRLMALGGVSIAAGLGLAALFAMPFPAAASFVLVGLGAANVVPVIFAAAGRIPGLPAGTGIAAVATVGYTGFLLGPPVIGWVASIIGLPAAHGLLALMGLLIAAFARVVDRRER